jgi:hypothetical protein
MERKRNFIGAELVSAGLEENLSVKGSRPKPRPILMNQQHIKYAYYWELYKEKSL